MAEPAETAPKPRGREWVNLVVVGIALLALFLSRPANRAERE